MKIKVEKYTINRDITYKILDIEECCEDIINSENICMYKDYDEYSVALFKCIDCEYGEEFYYETIKFCPFCGEPILIEVVKMTDKKEEYNSLSNKREKLHKERCKTDSKRRERELNIQVREIDKILENILMSDDFYDYFKRIEKEELIK